MIYDFSEVSCILYSLNHSAFLHNIACHKNMYPITNKKIKIWIKTTKIKLISWHPYAIATCINNSTKLYAGFLILLMTNCCETAFGLHHPSGSPFSPRPRSLASYSISLSDELPHAPRFSWLGSFGISFLSTSPSSVIPWLCCCPCPEMLMISFSSLPYSCHYLPLFMDVYLFHSPLFNLSLCCYRARLWSPHVFWIWKWP